MTDVAAYIRHAEQYGPECVFETAAIDRHISERDLGELKAWLDSRHRSYYWQIGRQGGPDSKWMPKLEQPRKCEHCGLDLSPNLSSQARYHSHCVSAARRRRKKSAVSGPTDAASGQTQGKP